MRQEKTFSKGLKDGIPICLGYLSVSFTFGMMAAKGGLPLWAIQLISMTNLTSAGQFTGTTLILSGGAYLEIAVTTFVINLRYTLMGVSLSQKLEPSMPGWKRALPGRRCAIRWERRMPDGAGCEQSGAVSGYYGRCDLSFAYAAVTIFRKKIENHFVRSFLAYVPYAVLAAMTIPDIFFATASLVSAAILLSYKGKSLLTVALGAVAVVFLAQRLLPA